MDIYSGFSHQKWWFSIVMLVYQRVFPIDSPSSGFSIGKAKMVFSKSKSLEWDLVQSSTNSPDKKAPVTFLDPKTPPTCDKRQFFGDDSSIYNLHVFRVVSDVFFRPKFPWMDLVPFILWRPQEYECHVLMYTYIYIIIYIPMCVCNDIYIYD